MLGENIKNLRRSKGYSQETLAQQLNVVRQTISKWEKGLSVPDAEQLERIAELFEVPVTELLQTGASAAAEVRDVNEVARQLAVFNEQFARQTRSRRRALRLALGIIAAFIFLMIVVTAALVTLYSVQGPAEVASRAWVEVVCTLDGVAYRYSVEHDEDGTVIAVDGDAFIDEMLTPEIYLNENVDALIAYMENYFLERGGTFDII